MIITRQRLEINVTGQGLWLAVTASKAVFRLYHTAQDAAYCYTCDVDSLLVTGRNFPPKSGAVPVPLHSTFHPLPFPPL